MTMSYGSGSTSINGTITQAIGIQSNTQLVKSTCIRVAGTSTTYQLDTPDATYDYYFLGYNIISVNPNSPAVVIADKASGAITTPADNTQDADYILVDVLATAHTISAMNDARKLANGLRVTAGGANCNAWITIFWLRVTK